MSYISVAVIEASYWVYGGSNRGVSNLKIEWYWLVVKTLPEIRWISIKTLRNEIKRTWLFDSDWKLREITEK
jgi:hypothetical protein